MTETLTATLTTTQGTVTVRLFPDHAPKTVRNFVELAEGGREWTNPRTRAVTKEKLYDGTIFHRVIAGFMIQGGDPLGTGTGGPGYRFADEIHPDLRFDKPYLLAMANAGPGQAHDLRRGHRRRGRGGQDQPRADRTGRPPGDRRRPPVGHHPACLRDGNSP
jgi:hypothetical protein